MGVVAYRNPVSAVVYLYAYKVAPAVIQNTGDVVAVLYAKAAVPSGGLAVNPYICMNMRPFELEDHSSAFPVCGHLYLAAVPGRSHIMTVGSKEEGRLEIVLAAVFCKSRIMEETAVVHRTRP